MREELEKMRETSKLDQNRANEKEQENEELKIENKRFNSENNDLKLRVQVLEGQLEEKVHIEGLFMQVRDELSRSRERVKEEREQAKQELLNKEEEVGNLKVVLRESRNEVGKMEEKIENLDVELNRHKMLLNEEVQKVRKGQTREKLLLRENEEQRNKLSECKDEVFVLFTTKSPKDA